MQRRWAFATAVLSAIGFITCSAADSSPGQHPSAGTGGSLSGAGGSGGSAAGWPASGSGGASEAGAGASGTSNDAGGDADAPFVCDGTGPLDCSASQATSYACGDSAPNHANKARLAVELVLAQHPEWFDTSTGFACCPVALEPQNFVQAVVDAINQDSACAQIDPNNPSIEIVVKTNNACSEQYVVLTSQNVVRNPPKYQGACAPAWL